MRSAEQRSYQPSTSIRLSPTRLAQRPRSGSSGRLPPHGGALGSDSSPSSGADFSRSSSHHIQFSFLATISCATVTDDFHIAKVSFRSDDSIFGLSRWVSIFLFLPPQDDWIAQIFLLWRKQGHGLAIPFNRVTFYWRPVNGWRAPVACGWVMVFSSVGATRISHCPLPRQVVGSFFFWSQVLAKLSRNSVGSVALIWASSTAGHVCNGSGRFTRRFRHGRLLGQLCWWSPHLCWHQVVGTKPFNSRLTNR